MVSELPTIEKYKYRDDCRFEDDRSFAARGTTRLHLDDGFHWIFHLNKFFNAHELKKKLQLSLEELLDVLEKQDFGFFFMPKWDGSHITYFYHPSQKTIHAHTLGSVDPTIKMQPLVDNMTFEQKALSLLPPKLKAWLIANPGTPVMGELCTNLNRIVTFYDKEVFYPFVAIQNGLPTQKPLQLLGFDLPRWGFTDYKTGLADALTNLEDKRFGVNPEGLVLYGEHQGYTFPLAKIKRPEYLALHKCVALEIGGPEDLCNRQLLYCENKLDDLKDDKTEAKIKQDENLALFQAYLGKVGTTLATVLPSLYKYVRLTPKSNGRQYAQVLAKANLVSWLRPALFIVRSKEEDLPAKADILDFLKHVLCSQLTNQQKKNPLWFQI